MSYVLALLACLCGPPVIGIGGQQLKWRIEDRRWNRFVDRWADVASRNPSALSVLDGCPDLSRLGG